MEDSFNIMHYIKNKRDKVVFLKPLSLLNFNIFRSRMLTEDGNVFVFKNYFNNRM